MSRSWVGSMFLCRLCFQLELTATFVALMKWKFWRKDLHLKSSPACSFFPRKDKLSTWMFHFCSRFIKFLAELLTTFSMNKTLMSFPTTNPTGSVHDFQYQDCCWQVSKPLNSFFVTVILPSLKKRWLSTWKESSIIANICCNDTYFCFISTTTDLLFKTFKRCYWISSFNTPGGAANPNKTIFIDRWASKHIKKITQIDERKLGTNVVSVVSPVQFAAFIRCTILIKTENYRNAERNHVDLLQ